MSIITFSSDSSLDQWLKSWIRASFKITSSEIQPHPRPFRTPLHSQTFKYLRSLQDISNHSKFFFFFPPTAFLPCWRWFHPLFIQASKLLWIILKPILAVCINLGCFVCSMQTNNLTFQKQQHLFHNHRTSLPTWSLRKWQDTHSVSQGWNNFWKLPCINLLQIS